MAEYSVAYREEAVDWMASTPASGRCAPTRMRLGCSAVAFTWRVMPADTGGKGSYGHRHKGQEEIYFVARGTVSSRSATTSSRPAPRPRSG